MNKPQKVMVAKNPLEVWKPVKLKMRIRSKSRLYNQRVPEGWKVIRIKVAKRSNLKQAEENHPEGCIRGNQTTRRGDQIDRG